MTMLPPKANKILSIDIAFPQKEQNLKPSPRTTHPNDTRKNWRLGERRLQNSGFQTALSLLPAQDDMDRGPHFRINLFATHAKKSADWAGMKSGVRKPGGYQSSIRHHS